MTSTILDRRFVWAISGLLLAACDGSWQADETETVVARSSVLDSVSVAPKNEYTDLLSPGI